MADGESGGAKTFGGIAAVIAIIGTSAGIMVAIYRPMQQSIDNLGDDQAEAEAEWHADAQRVREWIGEHDRRIEARDAAQWERIKSLERVIFGQASPVTIAPGEEP